MESSWISPGIRFVMKLPNQFANFDRRKEHSKIVLEKKDFLRDIFKARASELSCDCIHHQCAKWFYVSYVVT